jgi:hypothetical protein
MTDDHPTNGHTPEELVADPDVAVVMVTSTMWDDVQKGWRRTVHDLTRLVVATCLALLLALVFLGIRSFRVQDRQEHIQRVQACTTRTEALALGHLTDALKGLPADPTRNAKLALAASELAKLVDVDKTCS